MSGSLVTHQYHSKDGQFQVYNITYAENAKGNHGYPTGSKDGDESFAQVPWTCILSVDTAFDAYMHYGTESSTLQARKGHPLRTSYICGEHKLFAKLRSSDVNGMTQAQIDGLAAGTLAGDLNVDPNTGVIKHHMNYDIQDQENRIKNSGWMNQHHFVPDYMKTVRATHPVDRVHLKRSHECCVTFMPPTRPGKAGWKRYDGYTNGAFLLWENDGDHNIKQNKDLYEEEWIISAVDAELVDGADPLRAQNANKIVHRGMPYKLTSPDITFKAQTNMILHIGRLREV
jgi:hypothetical protein